MDISIVMPCLNEENTVGICVREAFAAIENMGTEGEVIVIDNGSTDKSAEIAASNGARVVSEQKRGYGSALRRGLNEAKGEAIVLIDADTTYSFEEIMYASEPILSGDYDFVIGNRFAGKMEKGAMPLSHRIGVKFLSAIGRMKFGTKVYDFHCGLRAISKNVIPDLTLVCDGMEFATEIIAEAARNDLRISEFSATLKKCQYDRKPKLRTIRDGIRHLISIIHA